MEELKKLSQMIEKLSSTTSNNAKINILKEYPECKDLLYFIYSPYIQFYVTSKNIENNKDLKLNSFKGIDSAFNILDLLMMLSDRVVTGHTAIALVNDFCERYSDYKDLIYKIIDKDLKCRIGVELINKVFPDLIPSFSVALAKIYEDYKNKIDFKNEKWFASRKMDGVRCLTIKQGDVVRFFSRQGKEFFTLDKLIPAIKIINLDYDFVLDGELCSIDHTGIEDFKAIVSLIRRKNYTIENPKYLVFDVLSIDDFFRGASKKIFSDRLEDLVKAVYYTDRSKIDILQQCLIDDIEKLSLLKEKGIESGWEGLIIRNNVPYEGKRTKNLLKIKTFIDDEFTIKNLTFGPIRYIETLEDGSTVEREEEMLSKVIIDYKGYEVGVGSGWSIEQRRYYYKNPDKLIGKTITVKHFGESCNESGGVSLRFPTLKYLYEEGRDL